MNVLWDGRFLKEISGSENADEFSIIVQKKLLSCYLLFKNFYMEQVR